MNDKDLITAREITRDVVVKTMKELAFALIAIVSSLLITACFFPAVANHVLQLGTLFIGYFLGCVVGASRIYNVFWDKMKTTYQKQQEHKES